MAQWKTYLECPYLPNPKIEKDVFTYLSSWAEETLDAEDNPVLDVLFKEFPKADNVINFCLDAVFSFQISLLINWSTNDVIIREMLAKRSLSANKSRNYKK